MAKLANAGWEAFAQAMVRGMTTEEAAGSAAYAGKGYGTELAKIPAIKERITELEQNFRWSGTSDVGPVIEALVKTAQAVDIATPAGAKMAAELWSKVAELKQQLPATRPLAARPQPAMTAQQWSEKYKPKS